MADKLKADNGECDWLKGKAIVLFFPESSIRTRKYDEAPEWQLPEPGAFASAKSFRDKVVIPFVNKLKSLIKNLTIQCVRLKEEVLQLREKLIDVMYENQRLQKENKSLKELLEKAYAFMKQFVIDVVNLLEKFMESVRKVMERLSPKTK